MTLQEVLRICSPHQYLARAAWEEGDKLTNIIFPVKKIEDLNTHLDSDSINATDWNIYEVTE